MSHPALSVDVRAAAELLPVLYGPRFKVFLATTDIGRARREYDGIELLEYRPSHGPGRSGWLSRPCDEESGAGTALGSPPTGPCLLVGLSPEGHRELAELRGFWRACGPGLEPPIMDLAAEAEAGTWPWVVYGKMLELAEREVTTSAERETRLHARILSLREAVEQEHLAAENLLAMVRHLKVTRRHLLAAFSPAATALEVPDPGSPPLRLLLPVPAPGLSAIDLHHADAHAPGQGRLEVTLRGEGDGAVLGRWELDYGSLPAGWFRCALPAALGARHARVELELVARTRAGHAPRLSLTSPGPGATLAILLWSGLPGSPDLEAQETPATPPASPSTIEFALSSADFERVRPTDPAMTPAFCYVMEDGSGLMLHPLSGGRISRAVLRDKCPPGTERALASLRLVHPQSPPVEFALALVARGAEAPGPNPADWAGVTGSGWVRANGDGEPHAVVLELPRPSAEPLDLHLATRVADGLGNDNAWAVWCEVRVGLRLSQG